MEKSFEVIVVFENPFDEGMIKSLPIPVKAENQENAEIKAVDILEWGCGEKLAVHYCKTTEK
jgi:hypothetical protein